MVALQILVLTVGVRILLGELQKGLTFGQLFLCTNHQAPSNIGLVHRPLKAERRVRLPLELIEFKQGHLFRCLFFA